MTRKSEDLTRALRGLAPPTTATRASARAASDRFVERAADRALVDISIWTVASPIGDLLLAVTSRGLLRVGFADEPRDGVLSGLAREVSPRILESAGATDEVRRELDEYFDGDRTQFGVKVDRRLVHGIARDVLTAARRIPFGQTSTYGQLAQKIGNPRAARAVGNALGSNPIPIVIPCHRVLRAGGTLGGYAGGIARKERLLELEGVVLPPSGGRRA
ncbi:MAG: methylated-DNA-[protein]-cysteine S-methyltransferase [Actinomycetota bacterium]|jgi:methylated-DNA-[protein]-cysteine S-methyltransferase|nr:methylated-DNA-[protein]-cysteine S-methyltransferase [Actinomycetota bacterium]